MGLHQFRPLPSGRMGILWTLAPIRDAVLMEFGCMGHMVYAQAFLKRAGVPEACKLYSTHMDETDVSLGGIERISRTVEDIVRRDQPRVIFLLPSSVPEMIGTDLPAVCEELQPQYPNVRLLPFGYGGFDVSLHRGVAEALLLLVKALPADGKRTEKPTFNIIGSCGDMFRFQADAEEILRIMEGALRIKPLCVLTSDTSVKQIEQMGGAHINLVIRREGEPAAKHLKKRFGTPYLVKRPYGVRGTGQWIEEIAQILGMAPNRDFVDRQQKEVKSLIAAAVPILRHFTKEQPTEMCLSLGAHADVVQGILDFGCGELELPKGICWCDCPEMASDLLLYFTEEQWTEAVKTQKKGLLMTSGEALEWAGKSREMQISNPDTKWRINPYEPPLVGFRGAVNLVNIWVNEIFGD